MAFVRVALPLTDVSHQLASDFHGDADRARSGVGCAAPVSPGCCRARIGQRVRQVAEVAERYRRGDLTPPLLGYGDDELGTVARTLDQSVQDVGRRLHEQARDRARMEAILDGDGGRRHRRRSARAGCS